MRSSWPSTARSRRLSRDAVFLGGSLPHLQGGTEPARTLSHPHKRLSSGERVYAEVLSTSAEYNGPGGKAGSSGDLGECFHEISWPRCEDYPPEKQPDALAFLARPCSAGWPKNLSNPPSRFLSKTGHSDPLSGWPKYRCLMGRVFSFHCCQGPVGWLRGEEERSAACPAPPGVVGTPTVEARNTDERRLLTRPQAVRKINHGEEREEQDRLEKLRELTGGRPLIRPILRMELVGGKLSWGGWRS